MGKEEDLKRAEELKERKARDKAKNLQYAPCPFCGKAFSWSEGKRKLNHCGQEECAKKWQEQRRQELAG